VLQGWSKSTSTDHIVGVAFMMAFAAGAGWGAEGVGHMALKNAVRSKNDAAPASPEST